MTNPDHGGIIVRRFDGSRATKADLTESLSGAVIATGEGGEIELNPMYGSAGDLSITVRLSCGCERHWQNLHCIPDFTYRCEHGGAFIYYEGGGGT